MLTPLEIPSAFSAAECARIIAIAEAGDFGEAGLVRGERLHNIRRARIRWLDETGEAAWVFDRALETVAAANRGHFGFDLSEFAERMQVAWYDAGAGGHFDWHVDLGDGAVARKRKLTIVVQLSDGGAYAGGALEINSDGQPRAATRSQGAAVLFPSFAPHRVTPVSDGARYSLTLWAHGPDFR